MIQKSNILTHSQELNINLQGKKHTSNVVAGIYSLEDKCFFLAIFIHQTHSPSSAAPSMAMLPGQEQKNQDHSITTSIFSLTIHLTSTEPLGHNQNCCSLRWRLVSVCCNIRQGFALSVSHPTCCDVPIP